MYKSIIFRHNAHSMMLFVVSHGRAWHATALCMPQMQASGCACHVGDPQQLKHFAERGCSVRFGFSVSVPVSAVKISAHVGQGALFLAIASSSTGPGKMGMHKLQATAEFKEGSPSSYHTLVCTEVLGARAHAPAPMCVLGE